MKIDKSTVKLIAKTMVTNLLSVSENKKVSVSTQKKIIDAALREFSIELETLEEKNEFFSLLDTYVYQCVWSHKNTLDCFQDTTTEMADTISSEFHAAQKKEEQKKNKENLLAIIEFAIKGASYDMKEVKKVLAFYSQDVHDLKMKPAVQTILKNCGFKPSDFLG